MKQAQQEEEFTALVDLPSSVFGKVATIRFR
jgi:hypothetical protein